MASLHVNRRKLGLEDSRIVGCDICTLLYAVTSDSEMLAASAAR
jgi:hypothetical protein